MKTILFWLFIAAVAFGVYKCIDNNGGDNDNTAADSYNIEEMNALKMLFVVSHHFGIENFSNLLEDNKVTYGVRFIDDNGFDAYNEVLYWI